MDTRQDFSESYTIPGDFVGWVGMKKMGSRQASPSSAWLHLPCSFFSDQSRLHVYTVVSFLFLYELRVQ